MLGVLLWSALIVFPITTAFTRRRSAVARTSEAVGGRVQRLFCRGVGLFYSHGATEPLTKKYPRAALQQCPRLNLLCAD